MRPISVPTVRLFSLAMIAGLALASAPAMADAPRAASLRVVGEAKISASPDMATFSTGVVSVAKTAGDALAGNSKAVSAVIAAVKAAGVEPRDIATADFSISPQYVHPKSPSREPPQLVGFEVHNAVRVTVRDLSALGPLLDRMVKSGANQASRLTFAIADRSKLEQEAQIAAVKDAMAQAAAIADAAGLKLTRIVSVEPRADASGPLRPMVMMARAEGSADAVPVEAGSIEVRGHATVVYEAEPK